MKKLPLTFWVTDFDPSQVTIAFHSQIRPNFRVTIYHDDNPAKLHAFLNFIGRIINDDRHYYISFASRFFKCRYWSLSITIPNYGTMRKKSSFLGGNIMNIFLISGH